MDNSMFVDSEAIGQFIRPALRREIRRHRSCLDRAIEDGDCTQVWSDAIETAEKLLSMDDVGLVQFMMGADPTSDYGAMGRVHEFLLGVGGLAGVRKATGATHVSYGGPWCALRLTFDSGKTLNKRGKAVVVGFVDVELTDGGHGFRLENSTMKKSVIIESLHVGEFVSKFMGLFRA